MKKYLYISIGGFFGAICRYILKDTVIFGYMGAFPLNTLIVNISGSFLLAVLLTLTLDFWKLDANVKLGVTAGFLGAYTTFSTMCRETSVLISGGHLFSAFLYLVFSTILGLGAAYLGYLTALELIKRSCKNATEDNITHGLSILDEEDEAE